MPTVVPRPWEPRVRRRARCLGAFTYWEGAFPLESPFTIDHSRRMKGGSELALEALMGGEGPGVGRGLGLLGAVSPAEGSPQGPDGKPRGQPVASQRAQGALAGGSGRRRGGGSPLRAAPGPGGLRWGGSLLPSLALGPATSEDENALEARAGARLRMLPEPRARGRPPPFRCPLPGAGGRLAGSPARGMLLHNRPPRPAPRGVGARGGARSARGGGRRAAGARGGGGGEGQRV
ncbi:hypothetical protein VULLAG_LOCUS20017 [Vulpes lagopus]